MKLFLDSNVIYSASRSLSGASNIIFQLKNTKKFDLVSSRLALIEAERNITEKEDYQILERFYGLIKIINIIPVDSIKAKRFYNKIINEKDAPILYAAKQSAADFLISLDKKHFFTNKLRNKKLPFKIMTPGEFISSLSPPASETVLF